MARSVIEGGSSKAAAARAFHATPKTVAKWVARFRAEGVAGLQDRSSRPRSSPSQTGPAACERVEALRRQRYTGEQIAAEVGVSAATVSRILKRLGLNRLAALEPAEPIRRYERAAPGEIVHIDIKKLGKFNRIGHRITGGRIGQSKSRRRLGICAPGDRRPRAARLFGDLAGREANLLPALSLQRPALLSRLRRQGRAHHDRQRLKFPLPSLRQGPAPAQDQAFANQTLHAQNQRQGRALRPDQPARMGLRQGVQHLSTPRRRTAHLASPLPLASPPWRHRSQTSNQQNRPNQGQRVEAPQLGQRNLRRSPSFLDADRLQQVDDGRLALRASGVKRGKFVRLWLLPKAVQLRQAAQTLRGLTPYGFICKAGIQTHTDLKSPLQQNAGTKQPNPPF